jgi:hypothetical protein
LPALARVSVCTSRPNQSTASLKIVECAGPAHGEDAIVCVCRLRDLPPDLPLGSLFDVELCYDAQGLLQVIANHRDSGRLATITKVHQADVES